MFWCRLRASRVFAWSPRVAAGVVGVGCCECRLVDLEVECWSNDNRVERVQREAQVLPVRALAWVGDLSRPESEPRSEGWRLEHDPRDRCPVEHRSAVAGLSGRAARVSAGADRRLAAPADHGAAAAGGARHGAVHPPAWLSELPRPGLHQRRDRHPEWEYRRPVARVPASRGRLWDTLTRDRVTPALWLAGRGSRCCGRTTCLRSMSPSAGSVAWSERRDRVTRSRDRHGIRVVSLGWFQRAGAHFDRGDSGC